MTPHRPLLALLATVGWGLAGLAALVPAALLVMVFDAPGSEENPWTWVILCGGWSFPPLCLLSIILSWVAWGATRHGTAGRGLRVGAALLPLASLAVVAVGFGMLQARCGGSFACR